MENKKKMRKKSRPILWSSLAVFVMLLLALGWYVVTLTPDFPTPGASVVPKTPMVTHKIPQPPPPVESHAETFSAPSTGTVPDPGGQTLTPASDVPDAISTRDADATQTMAGLSRETSVETRPGRAVMSPPAKDVKAQPDEGGKPAVQSPPQPVSQGVEAGASLSNPVETEDAGTGKKVTAASDEPSGPKADGQRGPASPPVKNKVVYSIQAGAYLTREYADKSLKDLKKKGHDPFLHEMTDKKQRTWYMVRLGRFENRQDAQAFLESFSRSEKMDAAMVSMRP